VKFFFVTVAYSVAVSEIYFTDVWVNMNLMYQHAGLLVVAEVRGSRLRIWKFLRQNKN